MMKRRTLVTSMLAAPALLGSTGARAQAAWPTKPVKLILPYAPGGATDFIGPVASPPSTVITYGRTVTIG